MIFTGALLSGAIGLFGGIAEKVTAYKTKKLELEMFQKKTEAEIAMRRVDAEILDKEWQGRLKVAEVEGAAAVEVEDAKAFAKSYELEPKKYGITWLDALRGSIRPLLTLYLVVLTSIAYYRTDGGTVNPEILVSSIIEMTSMTLGWWFGSRGGKSK